MRTDGLERMCDQRKWRKVVVGSQAQKVMCKQSWKAWLIPKSSNEARRGLSPQQMRQTIMKVPRVGVVAVVLLNEGCFCQVKKNRCSFSGQEDLQLVLHQVQAKGLPKVQSPRPRHQPMTISTRAIKSPYVLREVILLDECTITNTIRVAIGFNI